MAEQQKYPYDVTFQKWLLALAVQDPTFLGSYRDCLAPQYFSDRTVRFVAEAVLGFFDSYGHPPQYPSLYQTVNDTASRMGRAELATVACAMVQELYQAQVPDANYIRDRAARFAQNWGLLKALKHGIQVLQKDGDPAEALELFEKAMSLGVTREPGTDLAELMPRIPELWKQMTSQHGRIPTCFLPSLDSALYGGPRRGELYVVQAIAKGGKSFMLCNCGAFALAQGFRVLHVTIGDLKELDVGIRYACRVTRSTTAEVLWGDPKYMALMRQNLIETNRLNIRYYSPYTLTTAHLRAYMSWLQSSQGFTPDMLIVDYPDKMLFDRSNTYSELGRIYMELKSILDDFNCVGWVASQSNRSAADVALNTVSKVAESWDKAANADGIMPMSQTATERANFKLRIYVEMLRFGKDHFEIPCKYNFDYAWIEEDSKKVQNYQNEQQALAKAQQVAARSIQRAQQLGGQW